MLFSASIIVKREESRKGGSNREVIHISRVSSEVKVGDIIIFKCQTTAAGFQRAITNSEWDHVAIVVSYYNSLCLLESTGGGVEVFPLAKRLSDYLTLEFATCAAIRRLRCERDEIMIKNLSKFVESVLGKPYALFGVKLLSSIESSEKTTSDVVEVCIYINICAHICIYIILS
jgi:hypothetical protein